MKKLELQLETFATHEIENSGFKIQKITYTKSSIIYHVILPNGEEAKISLNKPKLKLYNASLTTCIEYQPLLD
jgi:hypothetical protein